MVDIYISSMKLDPQPCINAVKNSAFGGIATFIGTVRNNTNGKTVVRLEFEAYESMAINEMRKIAQHITDQWQGAHISIHHRLGTLEVGDIAVVIAVATPHRKAAFEACQYAIDTLKETVPIWKKEIYEDGEVWVSAHP